MKRVCDNGMKQYIRSRPGASIESVRRAKEIEIATIGDHALFQDTNDLKDAKAKLLTGISSYRPPGDASAAGFDLTGDTEEIMKSAIVKKIWDKKKKKMVSVGVESKKNMIKSESGKWIPASFKSGRYQKWMERTKAAAEDDDNEEDDGNEEATPAK
ncbi:unnamed protein product, partial [Nesidiocoris tenuis]